ncbi:MAG: LapA family protein [Alphaproteobacteria bacterium]|nr:LapA family protein [Alphaproteobacteria bacterium]
MRLIIAIPLLIILVVFALSNTAPVQVGFWPTGLALAVPLSVAVLVGMAIAFLIGGLIVWASELGQRRRARRAEHVARLLEEQVQELKARLAARSNPALTPPG